MSVENKICRFCLNNIHDSTFNVIDNVTRRLLYMFQLHLDVDISSNPLMCNDCAIHLKNLFNFKSLVSKVRINPWAIYTGVKLNMQVIRNVQAIVTSIDQTLCHFCMKPRGFGYHTFPAEAKRNIFIVLQRHIPELKLENDSELVTCRDCLYLLDSLLSFIKRSWDVEERIKKYIESVYKGDKCQIKLNDVQNFIADVTIKKNDPCDDDEPILQKTANGDDKENKFQNIDAISNTKINVAENKPLISQEIKTDGDCDSIGEVKPQINEAFVDPGALKLDIKSDECENISRSVDDGTENKSYCFDKVTTAELDILGNEFVYTEEVKTEGCWDENRDEPIVQKTASGDDNENKFHNIDETSNTKLDVAENKPLISKEIKAESDCDSIGEVKPQINEEFVDPGALKLDIKSDECENISRSVDDGTENKSYYFDEVITAELDVLDNEFVYTEEVKTEGCWDENRDEPIVQKTASGDDNENKFHNIDETSNTKVDVAENKPLISKEIKAESDCDCIGEVKPQINEEFVDPGALKLDIKSDDCKNISRSDDDDSENKLYCFDEVTTAELDVLGNEFVYTEEVKTESCCDENRDGPIVQKTAKGDGKENKFQNIDVISNTKLDVAENKPLYSKEIKAVSDCDSNGEVKPQINEDFVDPGALKLDVKNYKRENTSRSVDDGSENKLYCFDEVTTAELDILDNEFVYTEEVKTESCGDENRDEKLQIDEIIAELACPELDVKDDKSENGFCSSSSQSLQNTTPPLTSASETSHTSPPTSISSSDTSSQKGNPSPFENEYQNYLKNTSEIRSDLTLYQCNVCPYQTNYLHHFQSHIQYHTFHRHKIYRCGLCGFQSTTEAYLAEHIKSHKDIAKVPSKQPLYIHVAIYEADGSDYLTTNNVCEKPIKPTIHVCEICSYRTHCEKVFLDHTSACVSGSKSEATEAFNTQLDNILTSIRNEKSTMAQNNLMCTQDFKIDNCQNATNENENLPMHAESPHKSRTDAITSTCKICAYKTEKVTRSYTIMYQPWGFKCSECDYVTKIKRDFMKHTVIHKKMYKCEKCPFETKNKQQITRHMIAHTRREKTMHESEACSCKTRRLDTIKSHQAKYKQRTIVRRNRKNNFKASITLELSKLNKQVL